MRGQPRASHLAAGCIAGVFGDVDLRGLHHGDWFEDTGHDVSVVVVCCRRVLRVKGINCSRGFFCAHSTRTALMKDDVSLFAPSSFVFSALSVCLLMMTG